MNKQNITVSMPLSTYEDLEKYREKYFEFISNLKDCFDVSGFETGDEVIFDSRKCYNVIKDKVLEAKYQNSNLQIVT